MGRTQDKRLLRPGASGAESRTVETQKHMDLGKGMLGHECAVNPPCGSTGP